MTKQINQRWQSLLLATIAAFIVLCASGAVFAQKADKYPKPDFSAMEEYVEIVEWEYDFAGPGVPRFNVIAKPKQKSVPMWWNIVWRDSKETMIDRGTIVFNVVDLSRVKVGEPVRGSSLAPFKRQMPEVKSVMITEDPKGGDGRTAN